jgi:LmbE family N-acetylglucosaminyl deacetylase
VKTQNANRPPAVALAIGAHPDDIEFQMAGTLLLLKEAGFETHYLNLASGSCGSVQYDAKATRMIRAAEARNAARILGAHFHPTLTDDLEIFYELGLLRRLAAVIREIKPSVILTHPPQDYMEDHTNTCRLVVTAAFAHGMPNFKSTPPRAPYHADVTVYHCMPHGLRDGLRRRVIPGAYVDTTSVHKTRLEALAAHQSQQHWLDKSQGMNSYLLAMVQMSRELGAMSGKFQFAEGWRRHLHLGLSATEVDPLRDALGRKHLVNKAYEQELMQGGEFS